MSEQKHQQRNRALVLRFFACVEFYVCAIRHRLDGWCVRRRAIFVLSPSNSIVSIPKTHTQTYKHAYTNRSIKQTTFTVFTDLCGTQQCARPRIIFALPIDQQSMRARRSRTKSRVAQAIAYFAFCVGVDGGGGGARDECRQPCAPC